MLVGLAMFLAALSLASESSAAQGPYEPNDVTLNATGPLAIGQAVVAGLETQVDRDVFFFYVTSPGPSQVTLTVGNLGGGGGFSNLGATILDSSSTPTGGLSYVSNGETRTVTLTLAPQKYFVEVAPNEGFGDKYSLTGGGGDGVFDSYQQIAARCANGMAAVARAKTRITRAQAKLQRVTARIRRSRYSTPRARKASRSAYRKARARVAAREKELRKARSSQSPWCQIPQ